MHFFAYLFRNRYIKSRIVRLFYLWKSLKKQSNIDILLTNILRGENMDIEKIKEFLMQEHILVVILTIVIAVIILKIKDKIFNKAIK